MSVVLRLKLENKLGRGALDRISYSIKLMNAIRKRIKGGHVYI
jgi:hypothetical protein